MSGEADVAAETPAAARALVLGETLSSEAAMELVVRKALANGGLIRGLNESTKVITKHAAHLCLLAEDCNQPDHVKLVKALCADHNVKIILVDSAKKLDEWCNIDTEGN